MEFQRQGPQYIDVKPAIGSPFWSFWEIPAPANHRAYKSVSKSRAEVEISWWQEREVPLPEKKRSIDQSRQSMPVVEVRALTHARMHLSSRVTKCSRLHDMCNSTATTPPQYLGTG